MAWPKAYWQCSSRVDVGDPSRVACRHPQFARFLHRLASFSRLIVFDKRGTGLSDRVAGLSLRAPLRW